MVAATASLPTAPPRKRTLPVGAAHLHVIALVDTTGGAGGSVESYAYTPYGERAVFTASWTPLTATVIDNTVSYTGQRLDVEISLHYFRNRYYPANLGRFITRDPLGYVDGMSLYGGYFAYSLFFDPLGTQLLPTLVDEPATQPAATQPAESKGVPRLVVHETLILDTQNYDTEYKDKHPTVLDSAQYTTERLSNSLTPYLGTTVLGDLYRQRLSVYNFNAKNYVKQYGQAVYGFAPDLRGTYDADTGCCDFSGTQIYFRGAVAYSSFNNDIYTGDAQVFRDINNKSTGGRVLGENLTPLAHELLHIDGGVIRDREGAEIYTSTGAKGGIHATFPKFTAFLNKYNKSYKDSGKFDGTENKNATCELMVNRAYAEFIRSFQRPEAEKHGGSHGIHSDSPDL